MMNPAKTCRKIAWPVLTSTINVLRILKSLSTSLIDPSKMVASLRIKKNNVKTDQAMARPEIIFRAVLLITRSFIERDEFSLLSWK